VLVLETPLPLAFLLSNKLPPRTIFSSSSNPPFPTAFPFLFSQILPSEKVVGRLLSVHLPPLAG